jgi:glycosyltransferase involved in cell wall biosynthesis
MIIKYVPYQPHCFAFGGFDMQMLNTLKSAVNNGAQASKLDFWSRDNNFDILHLWGVSHQNFHLIDWGKKSNKLIVATVLLPYFDSVKSNLSYYKDFFSSWHRQLIQYYNLVDSFVVLNELQSDVLREYYKVPNHKINIIPNIVDDNFFNKPTINFAKKHNIDGYILCVGNVSRRKNQYNLAKACVSKGLKLVIIGSVLDGEDDYGILLKQVTENNGNILWINELETGSDELVSAFYYCNLFALPSNEETQPISLLEATAMNKPILTLDKAYSNQKYYKYAIKAKSGSVQDIIKAINSVNITNIHNEFIDECRSEIVGEKYHKLYKNLIDENRFHSNLI